MFAQVKARCVQLMGSEDAFNREASFLLQAIDGSADLKACTPESKVQALVNVANIGLSLNPTLRFCYVIPKNVMSGVVDGRKKYEKRVTIEPSYMGLLKLATDSGMVRDVVARVVYEGDQFAIDVAKNDASHIPYWTRGMNRGRIVGAYSMATLTDGAKHIEVIGADELGLIRSKSLNAGSAIYNDWEGEMARKAVIKRHVKYLPKSGAEGERLMHAIDLDNEGLDLMKPSEVTGADGWAVKVRKALEAYHGEDKESLREQCNEKMQAGEFDETFARNILATIAGA